jgi:hypothetical protein
MIDKKFFPLKDLSLFTKIDDKVSQEFIKWRKLAFNGLKRPSQKI